MRVKENNAKQYCVYVLKDIKVLEFFCFIKKNGLTIKKVIKNDNYGL